MTRLDTEWALRELTGFLRCTDQVGYDNSGGGVVVLGTRMRCSDTEVAARAHVVEQILDRVITGWQNPSTSSQEVTKKRWSRLRELASRATAALEREEELKGKLGDGAPQMDAGNLHPWVWDSASSLWKSAHFASAVQQAAIAVNANTQCKLGRRDLSEAKLFQQAFSTESPSPQKPRLWITEDDGSDSFRNVQRGAMALAEGLYAGIRNILAHDPHNAVNEQVAMEQLGAFSLLARWIDDSVLVTGSVHDNTQTKA